MDSKIELMISCNFKSDLPQHIVDLLNYLTRTEDYDFDIYDYDIPVIDELEHYGYYFFETESGCYQDWRDVFQPPNKSSNFEAFAGTGICYFGSNNKGSEKYQLTVRCEVASVKWFVTRHLPLLKLMAHYALAEEMGSFIGYFQKMAQSHQHKLELPTLIYFRNGEVYFSKCLQALEKMDINNLSEFV